MTAPYRLLLVDDNREHVRLLKNELQKVDVTFRFKAIYLKKDFTPTLEEFNPHIIIADYQLAFNELNAYGLMQQTGRRIPFIAVADDLSEEEVNECYNAGIDDYLLRSDIKRLAFAFANVLNRHLAEQKSHSLKERLKKATDDLKFFSENYEGAREAEKQAISRELHDELGQILTAIKIDINLLSEKVLSTEAKRDPTIKPEFDHILKTIDKSTQSVRKIAAGLRPDILDKLGLIDAVEWLAEETSRRHAIKCKTILPKDIAYSDNEYYSLTLFRIVQETLTNVIRHAEASEILIQLTIKNNNLYLTISDNGKGIRQEKLDKTASLGIIGLRERVHSLNGSFSIIGSENEGTVVSVIIPVDTHIKEEKV